MGDVVAFKKMSLFKKHKGNSLCRSGFHKWVANKEKQFDVKQGRLVTQWQCSRCHAVKVTSS